MTQTTGDTSIDPFELSDERKFAERRAAAWAFTWFFCLLVAYYVMRPLRDTMGAQGAVSELRWMFLVVFLTMLIVIPLYSRLAAAVERRRLIPILFRLFSLSLLTLAIVMSRYEGEVLRYAARVFFVWVSVFGLFSVSVFWSVMADVFRNEQGKRLFGIIAAGGSLGGIFGSLTVGLLTHQYKLEIESLLLIPIVLLEACVFCFRRLEHAVYKIQQIEDDSLIALESSEQNLASDNEPKELETETGTGGNMFAAFTHLLRSPYLLAVSGYVAMVPFFGTAIYMQQMEIFKELITEREAQTILFAKIDLAVQIVSLLLQAFVVGVVMKRLGLSITLSVLPIICGIACVGLAVSPTVTVVCCVAVLTRCAAYAIASPAREVLFTVVSREDKYKTKSLCDLAIYRGADLLSAQSYGGLRALGTSLSSISWSLLPISILWLVLGWILGVWQKRRS